MADPRYPRGLIDTSVVIDLELIESADLPGEVAVSAITRQDRTQLPIRQNAPAAMTGCSALRQRSSRCRWIPRWLVRTAVSTQPSPRQAAKRAAGVQ
ncbi:MAG TPA: hypothetical protein VIK60_18755 [Vicinamibacterales bacterium]